MQKSPSGAHILQLSLQQYSPLPQTLVPHCFPLSCKNRLLNWKKSSFARSSSIPPFFVGDDVGTASSSSGGKRASSSSTVGLEVGSSASSKGPSPMPGPRIKRFSVPSFSCQWLSIKDADVAESDPSTVTDTPVDPTKRRPWITTSREPLPISSC